MNNKCADQHMIIFKMARSEAQDTPSIRVHNGEILNEHITRLNDHLLSKHHRSDPFF